MLSIRSELFAPLVFYSKRSTVMNQQCPCCKSDSIVTKDEAKKTFGLLGMLGGAASALSTAYAGAEMGSMLGLVVAGPRAEGACAITGAILGAATGCIAGAKLGEAIDATVLDNYQCLNCGYEFSQKGIINPLT